jgi:hypothetical protein
MRPGSSLCVISCGSAEVTFRKNSGFLEADGCSVPLGVFSSSSQSKEKLYWGFGIGGQTFTVRNWKNSLWYIWVPNCQFFLLGNPLLNRKQHTSTQVAVTEVIHQLPPYHRYCKWHGTSLAMHPSVQLS